MGTTHAGDICVLLPSPPSSPRLSMSSMGPLCAGHGDRAVSCCCWHGGAGVVPIHGPQPIWGTTTLWCGWTREWGANAGPSDVAASECVPAQNRGGREHRLSAE